MQYWLIDADNQSPALAHQTAAILGWPEHVLMAGLPSNLKAWTDRAGIPDTVHVEQWEAPKVPDGADVLLAMAVGSCLADMRSAAIISRDGLVAGTLGRVLTARGVRVLAISAMTHPGLPYPHLTLPGETAAPAVQHDSPAAATGPVNVAVANQALDEVFKMLDNPPSVPKTLAGQKLRQLGFDESQRSTIYARMSAYAYVGAGSTLAIARL